MKVHILKCNNMNRFSDSKDNIVKKYDPTIEGIKFHYFNKIENQQDIIPAEDIHLQFGGAIYFIKNGEKFIIDDGYRDILCGCGYLVANDFDTERVASREQGVTVRSAIQKDILAAFDPETIIASSSSRITIKGESKCYNYTINFSTTSDIVHRNEQRRENNIPVYPFDKSMDKYGTWYISIFGEKKIDTVDTLNMRENDIKVIINMILNKLNDQMSFKYTFKPLIIKRRIINWEGL